MEHVLNEGRVDYLSLSRPLVREPDLPLRWQQGGYRPGQVRFLQHVLSDTGPQMHIFVTRDGSFVARTFAASILRSYFDIMS